MPVKFLLMAIIIDDKVLAASGLSEKELLVEIAFMLFEKNVFGLGKAREFCGLNVLEFQKEMNKREISYYNEEMLTQDIATMQKLFPK